MGWQGKDPSTDFRGGGFIALENFLYFARNFPKPFQDLIQMLDLEAVKPRTMVGATFIKLLADNESAFDLLYCITFKLMDHQWLVMHASYMDFNDVMKATRGQLERELLQEHITALNELPSYSLLSQ